MKTLLRYWNDQDGLTTVEYALLLGLIVVAAVTAWTTLGNSVQAQVEVANQELPF